MVANESELALNELESKTLGEATLTDIVEEVRRRCDTFLLCVEMPHGKTGNMVGIGMFWKSGFAAYAMCDYAKAAIGRRIAGISEVISPPDAEGC